MVAVIHDFNHGWAQRVDDADFLYFWLHLVHRLTATLAFLIQLSHFYEHDELVLLLSILQVGETFKGKLAEDGKVNMLVLWGDSQCAGCRTGPFVL